MMSETILEVLRRRDNMSQEDAEALIEEAKEDLQDRMEDPVAYGDPFEVCQDWFGLEPDYVMELIP